MCRRKCADESVQTESFLMKFVDERSSILGEGDPLLILIDQQSGVALGEKSESKFVSVEQVFGN